MRIVPVIGIALATAIGGAMLAASSHAEGDYYPTQEQNCASTGASTEGVGNCKENKKASHPDEHEKETRTHTPRSR